MNLKQAGGYLDKLDVQSVRVYALPQKSKVNPAVTVPLLDLYTQKKILYDYDKTLLPAPEGYESWSLRFTWHYQNPEYYTDPEGAPDKQAIVVIAGIPDARPRGDPTDGNGGLSRLRPAIRSGRPGARRPRVGRDVRGPRGTGKLRCGGCGRVH